MANHARAITMTAPVRAALERLVRAATTPAGLSRRARAVLLMDEGLSGREIATRTGYTPVQISRIRARFAAAGVEGLADRARSGRPPELSDAKRARILALTLKAPPKGLSQWSTREMAARVDVSPTTVHRLWRAHALQPHRAQTFKFTTDPEAEAKIHDVVGLSLAPPTNAVVLSVDEKTQIQALERTQPLLPLRPHLPARQTHDYHRHGLTSLYAALEVGSGRVTGECSVRHTGADFLRFLKRLHRTYCRRELHVILDNSSTHSTPAVKTWLRAHPRIHFHFTPTGASWLNMVEAWFGLLTRQSVRRGSFRSVRALIRHIEH
ncbi:MAG TPA: IS630 family transposase, partial [Gemmatimonadales bacterium]|nr:IS630 family transposase [Gemmatimonadales bacterium]